MGMRLRETRRVPHMAALPSLSRPVGGLVGGFTALPDGCRLFSAVLTLLPSSAAGGESARENVHQLRARGLGGGGDASGHVCVDTRVFSLPPCAALICRPLIPLPLAPSHFSRCGRPRRLSSTSGTPKLSKWTARWSLCASTVTGVLRAEEAPRTNAGFPKTRTSLIPMLQDWAIFASLLFIQSCCMFLKNLQKYAISWNEQQFVS
jgi:hypothetical protein